MRILLIHNKYRQVGGEDTAFGNESELLSSNGHEVQQMLFDNAAIRSWYDQLLSGVFAVYNPVSARAIQKKIEKVSPEIIHVHNYTPLVSPAVFYLANRNRIPVVLTLHNFRLLCPSATLFHDNAIYERSIHSAFPWDAVRKGVYRNSVLQTVAVASVTAIHNVLGTWRRRIDRYIVPTSFTRGKFIASRLGIPEKKLIVKPYFVKDYGRGRSTREDFFLFVGRLSEEKGIRMLLDAAGQSNFRLVIIGDGPLKGLVEEKVLTNPRITYLGFRDNKEVLEYLKVCKGLVCPSIWYETFGIVILEAFSTGTLVLASRLGAMAEVIVDGLNGLHFEPGNAKDLIMKIGEVNQNPERSRMIAERGYLTYLEKYTPEKNYEQLLDIYYEAIAEREGKQGHEMIKSASEPEYPDK